VQQRVHTDRIGYHAHEPLILAGLLRRISRTAFSAVGFFSMGFLSFRSWKRSLTGANLASTGDCSIRAFDHGLAKMGIWSQAAALAAKTPDDRNRYVDFLRSTSILFVITGHWLIATAHYVDGRLIPGALLEVQPWTQSLTWLFQVMPIFFIVGGYSNAVSLESARRRNIDYAGWLVARLNRLLTPVLVLLVGWALLSLALRFAGVSREVVQFASQAALVPTWFLAIYIVVVMLAPLTLTMWRSWGFLSFWAFVDLAVLVDVAFFSAGQRWLGWTNYFWIWLAVHQLGYAWRDGRMGSPVRLLAYSFTGFATLILLIHYGPYPLAMAGSPGEAISNTLPPKIPLLALAVFQFGLLLAIEAPMRRMLAGARIWTATVLINSMIMTIYLWHITVMIALVSLAAVAGGIGLTLEPATPEWWRLRPAWLAALILAMLPTAMVFSPLERRAVPADTPTPSARRLVSGAVLVCTGIALLSLYGFGGPWKGFGVGAFAMVAAGAVISGLLSRPNAHQRS
jgi:hypothetical protein